MLYEVNVLPLPYKGLDSISLLIIEVLLPNICLRFCV